MSRYVFTEEQKLAVLRRANYHCEYCKFPKDFYHDHFHFEHIFPLVKGGTNDLENVALSCYTCNLKKWIFTESKDPESGETANLYNPRNNDWEKHFNWSDDLTEIIGMTPSGRATIEQLDMNRSGLINARKALIAIGAHPAQNKIT
jgi:hypothetical protein